MLVISVVHPLAFVFILILILIVPTLSISNSCLRALDQYNAFGEVSGNNVTSLTENAIALNSLGRFDESLTYLDKALSIDPNNVVALINKGISLDGLGRFEDEMKYYDKAVVIIHISYSFYY
jgi:tetratricopeptide (TPR) repeat protein